MNREYRSLIKPGIDDLSDIIRTTALVVRMAIIYPAILDVTLNSLMSDVKSKF